MQIGFIGLGKMGAFMVERLLKDGHEVVVYNRSHEKIKEIEKKGAKGAYSLEELTEKLNEPKLIWMMIPSGDTVTRMIESLVPLLSKGDILIDGGNSYYKDSVRRSGELKTLGIDYLDVGTSGGIWGLQVGYCVMIGGEKKIFEHCEPIFKSLAPPEGYKYIGSSGAGHYVKMVHNGIEYGMMQAIAEGMEVLNKHDADLDLATVSKVWNHGSVVRSWLMELTQRALENDKNLESIKGIMHSSGEGKWTVETALEMGVPTPVITMSLLMRYRSQQEDTFSGKIVAALRNEFGGHAVEKKKD